MMINESMNMMTIVTNGSRLNMVTNETLHENGNETLNGTRIQSEQVLKLDDYSMQELLIGSVLTAVLCSFGALAVVSLNRTRTTPKTARFLSSALIILDDLALFFFTARKFIQENTVNVIVQTTGVAGIVLAYVTVGLMSLERLLIFCAPNFYMRRVTPKMVRTFTYIVWVIVLCSYFFVRYGLCYLMHEKATILYVIGPCNGPSFMFYRSLLAVTIVISVACYFKIMSILSHQVVTDADFTPMKSISFYKSTSLVLAYIVTITILTIAFAVMLQLDLSTEPLRIFADTINMSNCVVDPFMYILWYRETRMEILKMLSNVHPCFERKVEQMRIEVFNIVISESKVPKLRNKVHPM